MSRKQANRNNSHQKRIGSTNARRERRQEAEIAMKAFAAEQGEREREKKRDAAFKAFVDEARICCDPDEACGEEVFATREEMELEAIKRLEFLTHAGLHCDVLKHFSYRGTDPYFTEQKLYFSDHVYPFCAVLYWVDGFDETIDGGKTMREIVDEFERRYDCVVYHATLIHTRDLGCFPYMYYVSRQKSVWADDRALMTEGRAFIGCPDTYGGWELGTTWWKILGGGLGYSDRQVIPRTDYSLNHVHEGSTDDDGMSIDPWWHEAA